MIWIINLLHWASLWWGWKSVRQVGTVALHVDQVVRQLLPSFVCRALRAFS